MPRSSGIPRGRVVGGITRIIGSRATATTVTRVTESKDSLDATSETTTEHMEDIWLFDPEESSVQGLAGERVTGDLGGLAVADGMVDIQNGDRVTHGGVEYEVDTVVGVPDDEETDYYQISLVRRH